MAQTTRIKERQAAQAQRIKQAQAFMVPDNIDVAILGGGAAGLCAAITAAEALGANKRVVVFEKALESGRTILATGGGRCNFTNADLSFSLIQSLSRLFAGIRTPSFQTFSLSLGPAVLRGQLKTRAECTRLPGKQAPSSHFCSDVPKKPVFNLPWDEKSYR